MDPIERATLQALIERGIKLRRHSRAIIAEQDRLLASAKAAIANVRRVRKAIMSATATS
jgi:hypothetical protein